MYRFLSNEPPDDVAEFNDFLRDAKRRGCNLLITGRVSREVSALCSRIMFGCGDRRRILALTDPDALDQRDYLPSGTKPSDAATSVLDGQSLDRSATGRRTRADDGRTLQHWQRRIQTEIDDHASAVELEPAELRLGIESLTAFRERYSTPEIRHALHVITGVVRSVGGMGHYHLHSDDEWTDEIADPRFPFDARVELRNEEGRPPEQRWHVPALETTTDWVVLRR